MKAGVSHGFFRCAKDFHFLGANIGETFSEPVTDKIANDVLRISQKLVPVRTGALRATGRVVMTRRAISKYRRGKEVRYGDSRVTYANVGSNVVCSLRRTTLSYARVSASVDEIEESCSEGFE
jgi:hypothetical protein